MSIPRVLPHLAVPKNGCLCILDASATVQGRRRSRTFVLVNFLYAGNTPERAHKWAWSFPALVPVSGDHLSSLARAHQDLHEPMIAFSERLADARETRIWPEHGFSIVSTDSVRKQDGRPYVYYYPYASWGSWYPRNKQFFDWMPRDTGGEFREGKDVWFAYMVNPGITELQPPSKKRVPRPFFAF